MALRVLLADESSTIKKVMQLALQDFAVEVKAVHAGIDVLDVARSFQPDVVFADVLLQKKNGYEVCASLKADASLKNVPVVLMWSSFMDLDESLAKTSGAEGRLEKPFDVETLRKLILELVPKTRTQRLAHFLDFPTKATGEFQAEEVEKTQPPPQAPAPPPYREPLPVEKPTQAAPSKNWSMDSFEDPNVFGENGGESDDDEAFKPLELSSFESDSSPNLDVGLNADLEVEENTVAGVTPFGGGDDESWSHQDLSRFKLDLPPVTVQSEEGPDSDIRIDMGEDKLTNPNIDLTAPAIQHAAAAPATSDLHSNFQAEYANADEIEFPEAALSLEEADEELSLESSTLDVGKIPPRLSADRLEEIIRAQSRDIIESVVRKIVPDLATAIIREELERLLEDTAVRETRGGKGPNA